MLGMHGNYGPNVDQCDVLIALEMRFDDRCNRNLATYAKQTKVIHFEIDPASGQKCKTDVAVIADVKETLAALLPMMKRNHTDWHNRFREKIQN
jgi:acetolactate synthase-1/2/3 large subunit